MLAEKKDMRSEALKRIEKRTKGAFDESLVTEKKHKDGTVTYSLTEDIDGVRWKHHANVHPDDGIVGHGSSSSPIEPEPESMGKDEAKKKVDTWRRGNDGNKDSAYNVPEFEGHGGDSFVSFNQDLIKALEFVQPFAKRSTQADPIMRQALIQAHGNNKVSVTAMCNSASGRCVFPARGDYDGFNEPFVVPIPTMLKTLKAAGRASQSMSEPDVYVELNDYKLSIKIEGNEVANISTSDARSFPDIDGDFGIDHAATFDTGSFEILAQYIKKMAGTSPAEGGYDAIFFDFKQGNIVWTDTIRLFIMDMELFPGVQTFTDEEIMIPCSSFIAASEAIMKCCSEKVEVYISEDAVFFEIADRSVAVRQKEKEFPDYNRIMPKEEGYKAEVAFHVNDILNGLEVVSPIAAGNKHKVDLEFFGEKNEIRLSAVSYEGRSSYTFETMKKETSGNDIHMAFSSVFLKDFLYIAKKEDRIKHLYFDLTSSIHPAVMHCNDRAVVYLIMPINI